MLRNSGFSFVFDIVDTFFVDDVGSVTDAVASGAVLKANRMAVIAY